MAWNIHYQCCFQSKGGTQYAVNIRERDYSGPVVQLTGAAQPFVTQEDDTDNIFTPVRSQTGYLRVIDTDGTLLERLMPVSNTEKMVELAAGTYSGTWPDGTHTAGANSVRWLGFLQAQAYTQPWDNQVKQLEFPVKSLLGALDDVQIDESLANQETRIAGVLTQAFTALLDDPSPMLSYVYSIDDAISLESWLLARVQWPVFFSEETVNNQGDSYKQLVGVSYHEALSICLSLFGLSIRESGKSLYVAHFDQTDAMLCKVYRYTWAAVVSIADGGTASFTSYGALGSADLLDSLAFKGADNVAGFLPGARSASVTLSLSGGAEFGIDLPQTTEDDTTPASVTAPTDGVGDGGTIYVQVHTPRTGGTETYDFKRYAAHEAGVTDTVSPSTFADCVATSVFNLPDNIFYENPTHLEFAITTGAYPVRWASQPSSSVSTPTLKNGMFFNVRPGARTSSMESNIITSEAYTILSRLNLNYNGGYINIDFRIHVFYFMSDYVLRFSDFYMYNGYNPEIRCVAQMGGRYWDGSAWSSSFASFTVSFNSSGMVSNKTSSMDVEGTSGYFIPLTGRGIETLTFGVVNTSRLRGGEYDAHSFILSDLDVDYKYTASMVSSARSENVYRETISSTGFSEDKSVSLKIGTINNNIQSMVFIKRNSTDYIENVLYFTGSDTTVRQRPELRLLARMTRWYGTVRRTFKAVAARGVNLMVQRYSYLSRMFFGVRSQTDWRDDTEEIKFIEV